MKDEWGIGKASPELNFYFPTLANGKLTQPIKKYGTMSYDEAQAISKLLNAVNQGE